MAILLIYLWCLLLENILLHPALVFHRKKIFNIFGNMEESVELPRKECMRIIRHDTEIFLKKDCYKNNMENLPFLVELKYK